MSVQTIEAYSRSKARSSWRWVVGAGVLFLVVGGLAALQLFMTIAGYRLILLVSLIAGGAVSAAAGYASERDEGSWLYLLIGLSGLLVGAILGLMQVSDYLTLVWAVSGWLILAGACEMVASFTISSDRKRVEIGALGFVDMGMGLVLLTLGANKGWSFAGAFVAVSFILRGVEAINFGLRLRTIHNA